MRALAAVLAIGVLLGVSACGAGGGASQPSGSIKVSMTEFHFDPSTVTAPAGKMVFFLVNAGSVSHDFVIRDSGGTRIAGSELVSAGDSVVFTADNVPAGTYTIFCDQPGHESSGMKGTLTVT